MIKTANIVVLRTEMVQLLPDGFPVFLVLVESIAFTLIFALTPVYINFANWPE